MPATRVTYPLLMKGPQSRAHRERAQPAARVRLGLLEKHSDYVERARDFHRKEKRIKALSVRAQHRNPNEFYFGMIKSRLGADGTHRNAPEHASLPVDVVKIMKTQDENYVRLMKQVNEKKLQQLRPTVIKPSGSHVRFVEKDDLNSLEDIKVDEAPIEDGGVPLDEDTTDAAEVAIRQQRLEKLVLAERELALHRQLLSGKGKAKLVKTLENGAKVYKWPQRRQK